MNWGGKALNNNTFLALEKLLPIITVYAMCKRISHKKSHQRP